MNRELEKVPAPGERIILRGSPLGFRVPGEELAGTVIDSLGTIPASDSAKLALVNAKARTSLTLDSVYLYTVEALSNVYLPDRYAFMGSGTIKNAAADADAGIAFLTGHRWELLPLGRTFSGQYKQTLDGSGRVREHVLMGIYLPKAYRPNGVGETGTDDIAQGVDNGTIFDVSVGFVNGPDSRMICNVCNQNYYGSGCSHYRGSNSGMTLDEQIYAREVLGVASGVCTVTYENYRVNEVSAVYDGAVAGAGFIQ